MVLSTLLWEPGTWHSGDEFPMHKHLVQDELVYIEKGTVHVHLREQERDVIVDVSTPAGLIASRVVRPVNGQAELSVEYDSRLSGEVEIRRTKSIRTLAAYEARKQAMWFSEWPHSSRIDDGG